VGSGDGPGIQAGEELLDIAFAAAGGGFGDLALDGLVVDGELDVAEDADGFGEFGVAHAAEEEGEGGFFGEFIMVDEVLLGDVGSGANFRGETVEADAFIAIFAEDEGLAVLEVKQMIGQGVARAEVFEGAIVEDDAVLVDFFQSRKIDKPKIRRN